MVEVEIEWNEIRGWIYAAAVLLLIGVWLFGYFVTPDGGGLLTMQQWQLRKAARAYRAELDTLQGYCTEIAALIEQGRPDPVRAQVLAGRVQSGLQDGQEALREARALVTAAAQALREWSVGQMDYDAAAQAAAEAAAYLQSLEEP